VSLPHEILLQSGHLCRDGEPGLSRTSASGGFWPAFVWYGTVPGRVEKFYKAACRQILGIS